MLTLAMISAPFAVTAAQDGYALSVLTLIAKPPQGMRYPEAVETEIFRNLNKLRKRKRLRQLDDREGLQLAARAHSLRMLRDDFFAHEDPDGRGAGHRIAATDRTGLFRTVGENLAKISPVLPDLAERLHDGWVDSPGHYKNMIGKGFTHVGIGCAQFKRETACTQVFGGLAGTLDRAVPLTLRRGQSFELSAEIGNLTYYGWELTDSNDKTKAESESPTLKAPRGLRGEFQLRLLGRSVVVKQRYTIYSFFGPTTVLE